MSGSHSKQKGAQGERDLEGLLQSWGLTARRTSQVKGAPDILACQLIDSGEETIRGAPTGSIRHLLVECKRSKQGNPRAALAQVLAATGEPGDLRAAYIKDDRKPAFWVVNDATMKALLQGRDKIDENDK